MFSPDELIDDEIDAREMAVDQVASRQPAPHVQGGVGVPSTGVVDGQGVEAAPRRQHVDDGGRVGAAAGADQRQQRRRVPVVVVAAARVALQQGGVDGLSVQNDITDIILESGVSRRSISHLGRWLT